MHTRFLLNVLLMFLLILIVLGGGLRQLAVSTCQEYRFIDRPAKFGILWAHSVIISNSSY